jgi:hypothetical protein
MRARLIPGLAGVAIFASCVAASAAQAQPSVGVPAAARNAQPFALQPKPRPTPYDTLFAPPATTVAPGRDTSPSPRSSERPQPPVVCGMTIVPADPAIDPGIHVEMARPDTRYTLRQITPPICK